MRIVAISDIHNDFENLLDLFDEIEKLKFEVLVCCGDILDANPPKGFTLEEMGKIFIEEVRLLKKPVLIVPGNFDKVLISMLIENGMSLHGKGVEINGIGFYGYGGAKTPFETPLEPEEWEIKIGLEKGFLEVKDCKIKVQVTHVPPFGTSLDLIHSGLHVGSKAVLEFIKEKKPNVSICGHIQEAKGVDKIGETVLVNCGSFPQGYCALINIEKDSVNAEIVNLI